MTTEASKESGAQGLDPVVENAKQNEQPKNAFENDENIQSLKEVFDIGKDTVSVLVDFAGVVGAEAVLAIKALPRLAGVAFVLVFLCIGLWLSICLAVGQLTYVYSGSLILGVIGFILPQLLLIAVLLYQVSILKTQLKFKYTKESFHMMWKHSETDKNEE